MKLLFFLLFSCSFFFATAQTVQVKAQPLSAVITQLESEYNYLFSYKESDIEGVIITANIQTNDIKKLLTELLASVPLQFEVLNGNYIILTKKIKSEEELHTEQQQQQPLLCGKITDALTGQPLSYANVFLQKSAVGTSTKLNGDFTLQTSYLSTDSIVISYVGYQGKKFPTADFHKKNCPQIALDYLDYDEDFIVVTDYLTDGIQLNNNSAYTNLQPNKIGALPGQAEPDVLQTLQFLPGISSPDGTAAGINIRGGSSDQNLILWEKIPVYHSAHYFGMISAFNPYIMNEAQVYRGGFPANYGGRISGVINLESAVNKIKKPKFGSGINFLNAYTHGNFSTLKNKLSIVYSLRHSITSLWRSPTYNNITRRIQQGVLFEIPILNKLPKNFRVTDDFKFLDGNLKVNYQLNEHSEINFATFYGTNDFSSTITDKNIESTQTDDLVLENNGMSLSWQQHWSPHFTSEILALRSEFFYDYNYDYTSERRPKDNKFGVKNSRIFERQLQFNNTYQTANHYSFRAGYQLQHYEVNSQITKRTPESTQTDEQSNNLSLLHILYTDFSTPVKNKLGAEIGLRWTYNQKNIDQFFEPRLRLWYQPVSEIQFYANAGRYYQFLNQLIQFEGDQASIETPVWVLSGIKEVPILTSDQYQIGAVYHKKSLLIDIQFYHKKIDGLTSLASGFDENIGTSFHLGKAKVRGIDLLVKKRWGKFRSWISYSYSDIEHEFKTFFDRQFPGINEQPHQLHWVNTYRYKGFDFSVGWKLTSGTPYSLRENFRLIQRQQQENTPVLTQLQPVVNEFNSERLPMLHQLDASINYTYLPQNGNNWKATFGISLLNIYNQENLYSRGFFISNLSENAMEPGGGQNQQAELRYLNRANLGFTPNAVIRLEW